MERSSALTLVSDISLLVCVCVCLCVCVSRHRRERDEVPDDEAGGGGADGGHGVVLRLPRQPALQLARDPSHGPQEHVR